MLVGPPLVWRPLQPVEIHFPQLSRSSGLDPGQTASRSDRQPPWNTPSYKNRIYTRRGMHRGSQSNSWVDPGSRRNNGSHRHKQGGVNTRRLDLVGVTSEYFASLVEGTTVQFVQSLLTGFSRLLGARFIGCRATVVG